MGSQHTPGTMLHNTLKSLEEQTAELEGQRAELERINRDLEQSNRDLEQFAYVASHDLNTPLRKVKSFTVLMQEELADVIADLPEERRERVQQYMQFVADGADKSQQLIGGLLAFSRTGRILDIEQMRLDGPLDDALFILAEDLQNKGATVRRGPMPIVYADPSLMTRVFQNLIGNAVKFRSDDRKPEIEISCEERPDEWEVSVSDNGIGISERHSERVFVIFQRIGNRKKGMGLGLALCKRIVERHGGRIWFESTLGSGTKFFFTVPKEPRRDE